MGLVGFEWVASGSTVVAEKCIMNKKRLFREDHSKQKKTERDRVTKMGRDKYKRGK